MSSVSLWFAIALRPQPRQIPPIRHLASREHPHIEVERGESRRDDADLVWTFLEPQCLEHAVEVVHESGEITIHVDFSERRIDVESQLSGRISAVLAVLAVLV